MPALKRAAPALEPLHEIFEQVFGPKHEDAQLLVDHWRHCEAEGGFLVGRDVPSRKIARILRNLALFEPIGNSDSPDDLHVRIAGDVFQRRFGRDTTGVRLSELFDKDEFEARIGQTAVAIQSGAPYIVRSEPRPGMENQMEVVILPVWAADRKSQWILVGVFYFN